jgi:spore germination protein (amino acid permease)
VHEKLSRFHVAILVYMTQSGMVIFSLPRLLAQHFGTNGWLSLLLISIVVSINICLITVVYRIGNGKSIFEIMEKSIPKWMLFPFYFFLICCWTFIGCLVAKHYILVFQMIAFPTTSPALFKFVFDILLYIFIIKGIYNMSKAATVYFWLLIWIVLLLFYFYQNFQWVRLTPFIFQDSVLSIQGFADVYAAFLGFELILLLFPYIDKKTKITKAALTGNLMTTINYLCLSVIAYGAYGHTYLRNLHYPLLSMFAYTQFPFVQGTEILFYTFFIFSIIITSGMYLWASLKVSKRMFPINKNLLVLIIILVAYCVSYFIDTISEVEYLLTMACYLQIGITVVLPIALIVLILTQRMRGE